MSCQYLTLTVLQPHPVQAAHAEGGGGDNFCLVAACGEGPGAALAEPTAEPITVTLCYDFYYKTPRCYLSSSVLTAGKLLEDHVAADQGGSTATMEQHPYTRQPCVSLHPCQHEKIMASLLQGRDSSKEAHLYLALFLKVLANSLPTLGLDLCAA